MCVVAMNQAEVHTYCATIDELTTSSTPSAPSPRAQATTKAFACPMVKYVVRGKVYLTKDSITVYQTPGGEGIYYTRGTLVQVGDDMDETFVHVTVHGSTLVVTSHAERGKQCSRRQHGLGTTSGIANKDRIYLIEVADALAAITA